ncbi:MAG: hypothetical protein LBF60_10295 [Treponema sp.]|jgi:hypothetical protein|nr:hypothetical protein [Treponema sp.]
MDKQKPEGSKKRGRVAWHPAFYGALRLELEEYRDGLSFEAERPLGAEPLIIDVVDAVIVVEERDSGIYGVGGYGIAGQVDSSYVRQSFNSTLAAFNLWGFNSPP